MSSVIRKLAFGIWITIVCLALSTSAVAGSGKSKVDTPTLSCAAQGSTQASTYVTVTAGATGAPAGFSIQWMKAQDFAALGGVWPSSKSEEGCEESEDHGEESEDHGEDSEEHGEESEEHCAASGALCKASFSGKANLSRYKLGPGETVTVNIGESLFDSGARTSCPGRLDCGTAYVFRTLARAYSRQKRSEFSSTTTCSTENCHETCTHTQGYWKTH